MSMVKEEEHAKDMKEEKEEKEENRMRRNDAINNSMTEREVIKGLLYIFTFALFVIT